MTKRITYTIAFKRDVISYMETNHVTAYQAVKYFNARDDYTYDQSMFRRWFKLRQNIKEATVTKKRLTGAGRKPALDGLEELLADEIRELRLMKLKVKRSFISMRGKMLAADARLDDFKASRHWVTNFMRRNGFSLRRMTNLTTLTDDQLLQRAVDYMKYLQSKKDSLNLQRTLLMDETAVYFEDARTQTVDLTGRRHVIMKSTGFASMRVTVVAAVWADGRKAPPMVIHKTTSNVIRPITRSNGPIFAAYQKKAWVDSDLLIKWIDMMFPAIDTSPGKCIVWDSCRAHISNKVKEHCRARRIELIVIPGGLTPYLQAGDIGIYKEFKDKLGEIIDQWKSSDMVEYTRGGNPRPPPPESVNRWVCDAWMAINRENIVNSIASAGFHDDYNNWHIAKHDVYGQQFKERWVDTGDVEHNNDHFEEIGQEDDVDDIIDDGSIDS
jgi:hypothetical protein